MMDAVQVAHWKEFTKALCFGARPEATSERKEKLWANAEEFIDCHADEPVDGWDNNYCLCDYFSEHFDYFEQGIWSDNLEWYRDNPRYFANHLRMALRAGINAAVGEGGGVLGFTVGDLRQMFNGSIPDWFVIQYTNDLANAPDEAGIFL